MVFKCTKATTIYQELSQIAANICQRGQSIQGKIVKNETSKVSVGKFCFHN